MRKKSDKAQEFLNRIAEISRQFGLTISHEDWQGNFLVEDFHKSNIEWLVMGAVDETKAWKEEEEGEEDV